MSYHLSQDHTLSPACWCAPIIVHVPPAGTDLPLVVHDVRDADRLAQLGITTPVVVRPDVPPQGR